jgi:hypothetical protein
MPNWLEPSGDPQRRMTLVLAVIAASLAMLLLCRLVLEYLF